MKAYPSGTESNSRNKRSFQVLIPAISSTMALLRD
jgi:hypothetical protein